MKLPMIFLIYLTRYRNIFEVSMRGSEFIFSAVQLLHYKCRKMNFKRGRSYIDSLVWIKNKKATINPKTENDKCFQYAATVALNYNKIEHNPESVSNILSFISKCK